MTGTGTQLLEREPVTVQAPAPPAPAPALLPASQQIRTPTSPSVAERVLVPAMWLAILALAAVTTPEPAAVPSAIENALGAVMSWAALVTVLGITTTAVIGDTSMRNWSFRLGIVAMAGLGTCAALGHPVLTSAWGLGQLGSVSAGLAVTKQLTPSGR